MKERPIILKTWEVRSVLAGDKTQLRRVISRQPTINNRGKFHFTTYHDDEGVDLYFTNRGFWHSKSRFGKIGDRLWVKETTQEDCFGSYSGGKYYADMRSIANINYWWYRHSTCPSVHMPRKACRILLEIKNVRVERLHDIDHENISDNGISDFCNEDCGYPFLNPATGSYYDNADSAYIDMWEFDHGAGSWELNPWVWVIDFVRITQ